MSDHFNLKLVYEGLRYNLYQFEEPEDIFPVVDLTHKNYSYDQQTLVTADLKANGYSWWIGGRSKLPPTHVVRSNCSTYDGRYVRHKSNKPPADIQFIESSDDYVNCEHFLMTVPQIPKVFCISLEQWVVHKDLINRLDTKGKAVASLKLKPSDLRSLEEAGIVKFEVYKHKSSDDLDCRFYEPIPTKFWIDMTCPTDRIKASAGKLRTELMDNHLPLRVDYEDTTKYTYYQDSQGAYWRCEPQTLDAENASKLLGINCNVTIRPTNDQPCSKELVIPVEALHLGPDDKISLKLRRGCSLDFVLINYYDESLKDLYCDYKHLRFKQPFLHPKGLCFVNSQNDLAAYGIVKVERNIKAPQDKKFRVCMVSDCRIKFLPGTYAFAKDTIKVSKPRVNYKDIEEQYQQLDLQYVLPGGWRYWSLEDLAEYDHLMRSGKYTTSTALQVGSKTVELYNWPMNWWEFRTFKSKDSKSQITLYKKQNWPNLVKMASNFLQTNKLKIAEVSKIMVYAAALGLDSSEALAIYARLIGLKEMETLELLNQLAN